MSRPKSKLRAEKISSYFVNVGVYYVVQFRTHQIKNSLLCLMFTVYPVISNVLWVSPSHEICQFMNPTVSKSHITCDNVLLYATYRQTSLRKQEYHKPSVFCQVIGINMQWKESHHIEVNQCVGFFFIYFFICLSLLLFFLKVHAPLIGWPLADVMIILKVKSSNEYFLWDSSQVSHRTFWW